MTAARSTPTESATPVGVRAAGSASAGEDRREYRVEALAKGLRVLSLFTEQRPTWRISDMATETGLPLPTVYRLVMTMTSESYLDRLPNGDYRPGVKVLTLGTAALHSLDLVEIATPILQNLARATRETANLAVLNGDQILYLVRLKNADLITANIQVGSMLPAVYSSIGKLLLSYLDEHDLHSQISEQSFTGNHGPNAQTTMSGLEKELAIIRKRGWAMQDEELAYGLRSVAAPVRFGERVLAGANVAVQARDWPTDRIREELMPPLVGACEEISSLLTSSAGSSS